MGENKLITKLSEGDKVSSNVCYNHKWQSQITNWNYSLQFIEVSWMEAKNIGKDKQKTKMMQGIDILKVLN